VVHHFQRLGGGDVAVLLLNYFWYQASNAGAVDQQVDWGAAGG
jgi:hypothetical protein